MLLDYTLGQTSIILRVKIRNSTVSTGAGLTGLTSASTGLIISTIADNEATPTVYTVAAAHVQTIATLGTFAAPSASSCRFAEVDATNHKGIYEIQIADARFAVSSAKSLLISISGATNAAECDVVIPLRAINPYSATTFMTGVNGLAPPANWNAMAIDGSGRVDVGKILGTASAGAAGYVGIDWGHVNAPTTAVVLSGTTVGTITAYTGDTPQTGDAYARLGAPTGASTAADIAAVKSDTGTILSDVNTGAGAIYTRIGAPVGASISADLAAVKTDIDAGVKVSVGTGTGQLSVTSGVVAASGNWNTVVPPSSGAIATAVAAAILVTPAQLLVTDSAGRVSLNPSQALSTPRDMSAVADGSLTLNDALWSAIGAGVGRKDLVGTTVTLVTPSTHATLRTFAIDSPTAPTFLH